MRRIPGFLMLVVLGLSPLAPSSAHAEDALNLVKQAAKNFAQETRGVVGYRSVSESRINAPMLNQTIRSTTFMVQKDGIPVRAVMERVVTNGKETSAEELSKQEAKTNASYQEGKGYFKAPYDPRYMDAYTFQLESCSDCAPGSKAIRFSSTLKDEQYGKGIFILDEAMRVREVRCTPNAYPPNVTRGEMTFFRDEVGKGIFALRNAKVDYQGSMGPLKGTFVMDMRNEGFRRFASVEEAIAQFKAQ
ncbi:hypothetical protein D3C86_470780 [compost metagenome]